MQIRKIKLEKLRNAHDISGLPTKDGRKIKKDRLVRSGRLQELPQSTVDALKEMGLTTVIDVRIDTEIEEHPDTMIEGVDYIRLPLLCTATTGITQQKSMASRMSQESKRIKEEFGSADNYMLKMYEIVLFSEETREKIVDFFNLLMEKDGLIIWHCSAGKDRAGILSMLLEWVLGVDEKLIIEDYTASQLFQRRRRNMQKMALAITPIPLRLKRILRAMMNAKALYIKGAIGFVKERFGNIDNYFIRHLGFDEQFLKAFKDKYLE